MDILAMVAQVAAQYGMDQLVRKFKEATRHENQTRREERLSVKRAAEQRMREEQLNNQVYKLLYPDSALQSMDLTRYGISVKGTAIETSIAVPKSGLALRLPLRHESDRFELVDLPFKLPIFSDDDLADLLASSKELDIRTVNEMIFSLQRFDPRRKSSRIEFARAMYFDYRLTFGALEDELVQALIDTDYRPEEAVRMRTQRFSRRNELLPDAAAVASVSNRLCAGGVNVLLAFQRPRPDDDFVFLLQERSRKVKSGQGAHCLIPSGFHQPFTSATAQQEVSLWNSVFRETCEELFGVDEMISYKGNVKPDWYFEKYPQLGWFKEKQGHYTLEIVSFGLNLKDGSYQFGILLAVNNPDYWEEYGKDMCLNYEFRHDATMPPTVSTKDADRLANILTNPMCANASAFTIVEALTRLKHLEPRRVILPKIEQL